MPARYPKFDVTTTVAPESTMRSLSASAESPLNTTQWMAPMRAHASMQMANCGIMGRYSTTRSPRLTPRRLSMFAALHTSRCRRW